MREESQEIDAPKRERRNTKKESEETSVKQRHHRRLHRVIETDYSEEDRKQMARRPTILFRERYEDEGRRKNTRIERVEKVETVERVEKVDKEGSSVDSGKESGRERRINMAKQLCHALSVQAFLRNTTQHKHEKVPNPLTVYISFIFIILFATFTSV